MLNEAQSTAVAVGLGELKISRNPQDVLVAYGLGSCLGIGMYDPAVRAGGLLHAVLPEQNGQTLQAATHFVDSGIAQLMAEMAGLGALKPRLVVQVVGGANMLANSAGLSRMLNIGERNIAIAQRVLSDLRLPFRAQAIGGSVGRTMRLYIATGRITVRTMGGPEQEI